MPFNFVPVEAYRIDISEVEDVQRERLRITFEDGVDLSFGLMMYGSLGFLKPRLVLDGSANFEGEKLQKELTTRFYNEVVTPTRGIVPFLLRRPSPYQGWSWHTVLGQLEVTFDMGRKVDERLSNATVLQVGRTLELQFGTMTSDKLTHSLYRHGLVTNIKSYIIPPSPAILPISVT